jgi:hypothetical protein
MLVHKPSQRVCSKQLYTEFPHSFCFTFFFFSSKKHLYSCKIAKQEKEKMTWPPPKCKFDLPLCCLCDNPVLSPFLCHIVANTRSSREHQCLAWIELDDLSREVPAEEKKQVEFVQANFHNTVLFHTFVDQQKPNARQLLAMYGEMNNYFCGDHMGFYYKRIIKTELIFLLTWKEQEIFDKMFR